MAHLQSPLMSLPLPVTNIRQISSISSISPSNSSSLAATPTTTPGHRMPLNFSRNRGAIMIDSKEISSAMASASMNNIKKKTAAGKGGNINHLNGGEKWNIAAARDNQISPLPFEKADEETDCARILLNMHFFGTIDGLAQQSNKITLDLSAESNLFDTGSSDAASQQRYKQQGRWITVCDVCGKHIKGKTGAMARHQTIHSKLKRYECIICHGKYSTIANLRRHQKTRHNEQLVHECRLCDERFLDEEWLSRHARLCESNHRKDLNLPAAAASSSSSSRIKAQKIAV